MKLGIVRTPNRLSEYFANWSKDSRVKEQGLKVLQDSNFTCSGCKTQSPPGKGEAKYGWLTPVDLEHPLFVVAKAEKGIALCPICLAVAALNWSCEPKTSQGGIICVPGFTQEQITRIAIVSNVAIQVLSSSDPGRQVATDIRLSFGGGQMRHGLHENKAYGGVESDYSFALALASLGTDEYAKRENALRDLMFWPNPAYFEFFFDHLAEKNSNLGLKSLKEAGQKLLKNSTSSKVKSSKQKEQSNSEAPF